jgi:hypothetical protein
MLLRVRHRNRRGLVGQPRGPARRGFAGHVPPSRPARWQSVPLPRWDRMPARDGKIAYASPASCRSPASSLFAIYSPPRRVDHRHFTKWPFPTHSQAGRGVLYPQSLAPHQARPTSIQRDDAGRRHRSEDWRFSATICSNRVRSRAFSSSGTSSSPRNRATSNPRSRSSSPRTR